MRAKAQQEFRTQLTFIERTGIKNDPAVGLALICLSIIGLPLLLIALIMLLQSWDSFFGFLVAAVIFLLMLHKFIFAVKMHEKKWVNNKITEWGGDVVGFKKDSDDESDSDEGSDSDSEEDA